MKNFYYLFFAAIVFYLVSCSSSERVQENTIRPSEIINIGEGHNDGLALMLSKLQTLSKTRAIQCKSISRLEYDLVALETTKEVVACYDMSPIQKEEIYHYLDDAILNKDFNNDKLVYMGLSNTQEVLAKELDNILLDNDDDLVSLNKRIAAVEAKALELLSGDELDTVLSACYVASYTLQYWYENAGEWQQLSPISTRACFSWKNLGRADLKGAIAAGGGGLATKLIGCGPVGWKAWAALIIGGAVVGSLDNAYDQLFPVEEQCVE